MKNGLLFFLNEKLNVEKHDIRFKSSVYKPSYNSLLPARAVKVFFYSYNKKRVCLYKHLSIKILNSVAEEYTNLEYKQNKSQKLNLVHFCCYCSYIVS